MVNPHPADGKNSVLFQEVSAVRHYTAKGISNGAVGGAEKSAEAIVARNGRRAELAAVSRTPITQTTDRKREAGNRRNLATKGGEVECRDMGARCQSGCGETENRRIRRTNDGVLPKPRSARNRHASWCGRGGVPPLPDYAGHDTRSGVKVSNGPVRRNQIAEDKLASARMRAKEVGGETRRTRTESGYKAFSRASQHWMAKPQP